MTHKQRGGAFTANQLHDLLAAGYAKNDSLVSSSINAIPLDINNKFLYNDTFQVFVEPDSVRFIVIHRGTAGTVKDWGNNVRNMVFGNSRSESSYTNTMSNRQKTAEDGHKTLKQYLIDLYTNRSKITSQDKLKQNIVSYIEKLLILPNQQLKIINIDEAIDELLKTRMSVIGHSQGAVYAYLYGNEGAETIVYNPAPFNGKKPDNTYIIRRKGDPVSVFTSNDARTVSLDKLQGKNSAEHHSISSLDGVPTIFGNKFLYNADIEIDKGVQPSSTEPIEALNEKGEIVQTDNKTDIGKLDNTLVVENAENEKKNTDVIPPPDALAKVVPGTTPLQPPSNNGYGNPPLPVTTPLQPPSNNGYGIRSLFDAFGYKPTQKPSVVGGKTKKYIYKSKNRKMLSKKNKRGKKYNKSKKGKKSKKNKNVKK